MVSVKEEVARKLKKLVTKEFPIYTMYVIDYCSGN